MSLHRNLEERERLLGASFSKINPVFHVFRDVSINISIKCN